MRVYIHIGPERSSTARVQSVLASKRDALLAAGVVYARSPGNTDHTRLFMATTDPAQIDPLRYSRGYITGQQQTELRVSVMDDLAREVAQHRPHTLIVSCPHLGAGLHNMSELARLRAVFAPLSDDIHIIAHVDLPARMLVRSYATQILGGRGTSLQAEFDLTTSDNWRRDALARCPPIDPAGGVFAATQAPAPWLDLPAFTRFWESVFGAGNVHLHSYAETAFARADITQTLCTTFDIPTQIGRAEDAAPVAAMSATSLTRGRQLNVLILRMLAQGERIVPRQIWRSFVRDVGIDGPPLDIATLHPITTYFAEGVAKLLTDHTGLSAQTFDAPPPADTWHEADPQFGYRPSQYLLGYMWRIDKATREHMQTATADIPPPTTVRAVLPPRAVQAYEKLQKSSFVPHNKMGTVDEEAANASYAAAPRGGLPTGTTGKVIVACMKNEAPYITEWIAHHRAIGIDHFLIYTNGCEDGTTEILDRLQDMGVLKHRNNDGWKGNSPQQHALKQALKEPLIKNAAWIIHIDVDEFINVRCGNGTLDDFLERVPDATNVAMTWRLFGHNGITQVADGFVTQQFDTCAPKFCPKPHTVWGFKTMFKNIGAYEKISCHRPNKLNPALETHVKWVNGSGADITKSTATNGWRSSKRTIGYDLLQLNHYALRSVESFLIKRQRGRALHVDRSIGINYWIRMDWGDFRDITIQRNLPRMRAAYDDLMLDTTLRSLHDHGLRWHIAKAAQLRRIPEFADLYAQALALKLNEVERTAYALSLDTES